MGAASTNGHDAWSLTNLRILITEDEGIVAADIKQTLESLGHTVCAVATSGHEAIEQAGQMRPELVLMDIHIEGDLDGVDAACQIRERYGVPVIFLTAYADQGTLDRAALAQPHGYVRKPFDEKDLEVAILVAVCRHRALLELDHRVRTRTEELARSEIRYRQIAALAELGRFALETMALETVQESAVKLVQDTLGVEIVDILEPLPELDRYVIRSGRGLKPGLVGTAVSNTDTASYTGHTIEAASAVVVDDWWREPRFTMPTMLSEYGVVSSISVAIRDQRSDRRSYGLLSAHTRSRREFSESDVHFLEAVATILASAVLRTRAEQDLYRSERLAETARLRSEHAEAAVQERDEFISVAAHELRTPLTALQLKLDGMHGLLERESRQGTTGAPLDKLLTRVSGALRQTARLSSLVERLLDVSRVVSGRLELRREIMDLGAVAREALEELRPLAEEAQVELRVSMCDDLGGCWDRARLHQVVGNLLANAIKFGARNPVSLVIEATPRLVRLTVLDQGIGIAAEDAPRIFNRFQRAGPDGHYAGLGLGLYVTRYLVEAHGGTIHVASCPGEGSTFTVDLPRDPKHSRLAS